MAKTKLFEKNILVSGRPLDGYELSYLTNDNISDIKTVLAYDYEDGKPWHDNTCVLEIIFHNYQENIGNDRILILYQYSFELLADFSRIMLELPITENGCYDFYSPGYPICVKFDLSCEILTYNRTNEERGIKTEDFDEFSCSIKHKKHFYKANPEMPDD